MGWKIHIVNELPTEIADFQEEPFQFEVWLQQQSLLGSPEESLSSSSRIFVNLFYLFLYFFVLISSYL